MGKSTKQQPGPAPVNTTETTAPATPTPRKAGRPPAPLVGALGAWIESAYAGDVDAAAAALRCSPASLRRAATGGRPLSPALALVVELLSGGAVSAAALRAPKPS